MGWGSSFKKSFKRATKRVKKSVKRVSSQAKKQASRAAAQAKAERSRAAAKAKATAIRVARQAKAAADAKKVKEQIQRSTAQAKAEGSRAGRNVKKAGRKFDQVQRRGAYRAVAEIQKQGKIIDGELRHQGKAFESHVRHQAKNVGNGDIKGLLRDEESAYRHGAKDIESFTRHRAKEQESFLRKTLNNKAPDWTDGMDYGKPTEYKSSTTAVQSPTMQKATGSQTRPQSASLLRSGARAGDNLGSNPLKVGVQAKQQAKPHQLGAPSKKKKRTSLLGV